MSTAPYPLDKGDRGLRAADHYHYVAGIGPDNLPKFFNLDAAGNLLAAAAPVAKPAVSTYSPDRFKNLGADATKNVKASAGNVFSLTCHNENGADRYLQLHNKASAAANAEVPEFAWLVPAGGQIIVGADFFTAEGLHFAAGITFAFSTTKDSYTAGSAGDQSTWVNYK